MGQDFRRGRHNLLQLLDENAVISFWGEHIDSISNLLLILTVHGKLW